MASRIDRLIGRVADEQLRSELQAAAIDIRRITDFGLVFESHLPETVRLPHHPIRRGIKVAYRDGKDKTLYEVVRLAKDSVVMRRVSNADGSALSSADRRTEPDVEAVSTSLVAVAEFGDAIYPGLHHLGRIDRGGDKPAHVVINGENHHTLEALRFTHAGKIDCIYIDPPYNTGARDWKYDNDYVDADDSYRHSKWLAFMERRLKLAKDLLKPDDSALICTIDEKEYLRLGMLLEQVFAGARIQMISSLINPANVARQGGFGRNDEYLYFVMIGTASPQRVRLSREWVSAKGRTHTGNVRWDLLRRSSTNAERAHSPGCFYPIYIDPDGPRIVKVGEPLPAGISDPPPIKGLIPTLPIRKDGSEGNWQWAPDTFRARAAQGRVRITGSISKGFVVSVLKEGEYQKIERGEFQVVGKKPDGSLIVGDIDTDEVLATPGSQWRIASHDATQYGSRLLAEFIPGRRFPFPKSLYAVEDALKFFVNDKPDAVILDFFGGSGTTTHAVMRLNHQDGGCRRSILVTNNEVSESEAKALRVEGHQPGGEAWEALGIFEHVTRPRVLAAVTGRTAEDEPVKGDYKFTDEFSMSDGFEENIDFFNLVYLDEAQVEVDRAFAAIAPLLWLRAGAGGRIIGECKDVSGRRKPYAWTELYGVLFNTDRWRTFVAKLPETATTAYVVTDSNTEFARIAGELPGHIDVVRLYERYLTTFAINEK